MGIGDSEAGDLVPKLSLQPFSNPDANKLRVLLQGLGKVLLSSFHKTPKTSGMKCLGLQTIPGWETGLLAGFLIR